MKKVLLYWSHICVLHTEEKRVLANVQKSLLEKGIDLKIEYFGLGYANRMSDFVAEQNSVIPDIIVSADLEMFEHKQLFEKLGKLHKTETWLPLKKTKIIQDIRRNERLLPLLAIPLVCYTRDLAHCENKSITEVIENEGFVFGGINNSAGKTITKIAIEKYSEEFAEKLLEKSVVTDMPIGAFQAVRTNVGKTAVVPLLYALRADGVNTFITTLKEGVFLLPSYFACKTTVDEDIGKIVLNEIFTQAFCNMYSKNGNLIVCLDKPVERQIENSIENYSVLSQKFIEQFDEQSFYNLYTSKIETAKQLKVCG